MAHSEPASPRPTQSPPYAAMAAWRFAQRATRAVAGTAGSLSGTSAAVGLHGQGAAEATPDAPMHTTLTPSLHVQMDGVGVMCPEAQQHTDTHTQRSGSPVSHSDTVRASPPDRAVNPARYGKPDVSRPCVSAVRPDRQVAPDVRVGPLCAAVSRRARVEKLIQHGVERDAALRFETLSQGWIERITA